MTLGQWKLTANALCKTADSTIKANAPDIRAGTPAAFGAVQTLSHLRSQILFTIKDAKTRFTSASEGDGETIQLLNLLAGHERACAALLPPPRKPIGFRTNARGESETLQEAMDVLNGEADQEWSWDGIARGLKNAAVGAGLGLATMGAPADGGAVLRGLMKAVAATSPSERDKKQPGVKRADGRVRTPGSPPSGNTAIGGTTRRGPWLSAGSSFESEDESETGWDIAARRLRAGAPIAGSTRATPVAGGHAPRQSTAAQASEARKRIRAATTPAFATALDTAANPDLIVAFVRKTPPATDLAKLRTDYVATAVRHFAQEFVRTISSAPKGTSENLALGAIIAAALSQTGQRFPLVPPAAVPAMSVLIHKALQPQLPALAKMAAAIAVAPAATARPGMAGALRETAW